MPMVLQLAILDLRIIQILTPSPLLHSTGSLPTNYFYHQYFSQHNVYVSIMSRLVVGLCDEHM